MKTKSKRALVGVGLACTLLLTGCASAHPSPGLPETSGPETSVAPADANNVDLHFIAMMTPHHEQAVEMSRIVLDADGISDPTLDLAQRILDGQQAEIDTMLGWANAWGLGDLMTKHSVHVANGMLTAQQMDELRTQAVDAETLFLELMYSHHEGAVLMTEDQIARGGYAPLVKLAEQMVTVQTAEMVEMLGMLGKR